MVLFREWTSFYIFVFSWWLLVFMGGILVEIDYLIDDIGDLIEN